MDQAHQAEAGVSAGPPATPGQLSEAGSPPQDRARGWTRLCVQHIEGAHAGRAALADLQPRAQRLGLDRAMGQKIDLVEPAVADQSLEQLEIRHVLAEHLRAQSDPAGRQVEAEARQVRVGRAGLVRGIGH
ncbi:hypothetical protein [Brevundimonas sp. R86498]|uniref:hypothetical protein n=1 Tax=Brevundimonas sp. R86498 TaxID=3093845 RepID=UPI0037C69643